MFDSYDDDRFEFNARYDYVVEAYGAPCPRHGTLTWQGDCPQCDEEMGAELEARFANGAAQRAACAQVAADCAALDDELPF